jgi:hypothetical protein
MPVATDTLNEDIKGLTATVAELARRVDENIKDSHRSLVEVIQQLGNLNAKVASISTIIKVAGTFLGAVIVFAGYLIRSGAQTIWSSGEKEGALQAKVEILERTLLNHINSPVQQTNRVVPGPIREEPKPAPDSGPAVKGPAAIEPADAGPRST